MVIWVGGGWGWGKGVIKVLWATLLSAENRYLNGGRAQVRAAPKRRMPYLCILAMALAWVGAMAMEPRARCLQGDQDIKHDN